jgi:hypothetical protein
MLRSFSRSWSSSGTGMRDCSALASAGLNFDTIYEEIDSQYHRADKQRCEKGRMAFIEEVIARLQDFGMTIPIADKISLLAYEHNEKLF